MPEPLVFLVLILASWRVWHLLAEDTILERPREWFVREADSKQELWLCCPYCAGFWISAAITSAWYWYDDLNWWTLPFAVFAVSAGVVFCQHVKEALIGEE